MNILHKEYLDKFKTINGLYKKYNFPTSQLEIEKDIFNISDFKVTVPLVGAFSAGKSSLINALINSELLSTDIVPETAIPTEISYGNENICYCMRDGSTIKSSLADSEKKELSVNTTQLVKIYLQNDFLEQIPDIKIVDMPGFDSGIDIHNRAINDYLPKSLAYIIAISADEGTIRASILNFLAELKLNKMPVYIVITKSDKINLNDLDYTIEHIKDIVKQKMKLEKVPIAVTSAAEEEIDELKELFLDIQKKSNDIFQNYYSKKLKQYIQQLQSYLEKQISMPNINLIQIQEDKKLLQEKISNIQKDLSAEKENFASQSEHSIEQIYSKVNSELQKNIPVFENIVLQGGGIQEKINSIVRSSITTGIREQLEPKLQRYVSNISNRIDLGNILLDNQSPLLDKTIIQDNEAKRTALQSAVTPVATVVATVVGSLLGGPIGTVIGAVAGAFLGSAVNKHSRQQEEAQKQEAAHSRVQKILNEVMATVRPQVESTVQEMIANVNQEIDTAFFAQIELKQKELNDLETSLAQSEQEQQTKIAAYQADLECLMALQK